MSTHFKQHFVTIICIAPYWVSHRSIFCLQAITNIRSMSLSTQYIISSQECCPKHRAMSFPRTHTHTHSRSPYFMRYGFIPEWQNQNRWFFNQSPSALVEILLRRYITSKLCPDKPAPRAHPARVIYSQWRRQRRVSSWTRKSLTDCRAASVNDVRLQS